LRDLQPIEVGPDEFLAAASAEAKLNGAVASVRRFDTSNRHHVYDVRLTDGRAAVVRLGLPAQRAALGATLRWSQRLRPLGIPLPRVLALDLASEFPFVILERLPGADLRTLIHTLKPPALGQIAGQMAVLQGLIAKLPGAGRFGFAAEADLAPCIRWSDVLAQSLAESRQGGLNEAAVDAVEQRFARLAKRLDDMPATTFLPDTTMRNVIVTEAGGFSGIVDVDRLCWGDPRYAPARAAMALLNSGLGTAYPEAWLALSGGAADAGFWLYVAICCTAFMADLGRADLGRADPGRAAPGETVDAESDRLQRILAALLDRIDSTS
jgi:aminoglycoside phosphotransferase